MKNLRWCLNRSLNQLWTTHPKTHPHQLKEKAVDENEGFPRKYLKPLDLATLIKAGLTALLVVVSLGVILYVAW